MIVVTVDMVEGRISECEKFRELFRKAVELAQGSDTVTIAIPKRLTQDLCDLLYDYGDTLMKLKVNEDHAELVRYLGFDNGEEE